MKNNFIPSLYVAVTNCGGFSVEIHADGAWCRARDEWNGRSDGRARWQRIKWDNNGEPYLQHHGRKYLFSDMLRAS